MIRYLKLLAAVVTLICLSLIVVQLNPGFKQTIVLTQPNTVNQPPISHQSAAVRHGLSTSHEEPSHIKFPEPREEEVARDQSVANKHSIANKLSKVASVIKQKAVDSQKKQIPRVLCLVTTSPNNHATKARAVNETWGAKCDKLVFVSSKQELGLPIIVADCEVEDHDHLWCKNRKGIVEAHKMFDGQYDWFMKADDDTYVVVENLKHLVSSHDPNEPIWFGCPFNYPGEHHIKYHSGGAGYVLSHEAIVRLIKAFETPKEDCDALKETGPDDLYLGSCFEKTGVKFGDERDHLGRPRFFPFSPQTWLNPRVSVYNTTDWFKHYSVNHYGMGEDCCSDTSISFHYISADDMYVYDFFLYHMKVKKLT